MWKILLVGHSVKCCLGDLQLKSELIYFCEVSYYRSLIGSYFSFLSSKDFAAG